MSQEFGYPSGIALVAEVAAPDLDGGLTGPLATLLSNGFDEAQVRTFATALRLSGKLSVDAFLEHRPDLRTVGKAAIAAALIPRERTLTLFARPEGGPSTYDHIWASLNTEPSQFKKNRLRVVTFNYDRTLEEYLAQALANSYSLKDDQVEDLLGAVPIIHVHGVLGNHPRLGGGQSRPYATELTRANIDLAAGDIRILHEQADDDPNVKRAREALQESERVVFLGFGYDPINVRRLGLEHLGGAAAVYGTAFGLTRPEKDRVKKTVGRDIVLGDADRKSLAFLRETIIL